MSSKESPKELHKAYDQRGGVRLDVLQPFDFKEKFDYKHIPGAIEAHLANFGRF